MLPRKISTLRIVLRLWPRLAKASAAFVAVVATVGCETRTTGVTQLPVPPNREQMAFTSAAPFNGPPAIATNECKQGRGNYRLGSGDKIRVIVLLSSLPLGRSISSARSRGPGSFRTSIAST